MTSLHGVLRTATASLLVCAAAVTTEARQGPVTTAFTYQGELRNNGAVVVQNCDFTFRLYDQNVGGAPLGSQVLANVPVTRGVFTVQLDFGANAFDGDERWLEIDVACPTGSGVFTTLAPRQELTPTPYASYAEDADTVDGINAGGFLRANVNDSFTAGTLTVSGASTLDVDGTLRMDGPVTKTGTGLVTNFNADFLDGIHGGGFLRANANDTFTAGTLFISPASIFDVDGTLRMDGPVIKTGTGLVANFNADLLDGVSASGLLRSNTNDSFTSGTLTFNGGTTLDVNGTLRMDGTVIKTGTGVVSNFNADLLDGVQGLSYLRSDASDSFTSGTLSTSVGTTLDVNGTLRMDGPIFTGVDPFISTSGTYTIGGANITIALGDSSADNVLVPGNIMMGSFDSTRQIYFHDTTSPTSSSLGWNTATATGLSTCTTPGAMTDAFIWNIEDNTSTGWALTNGTDAEFVVNSSGNGAIDGTLTTFGACDLAESFLGDRNLPAGSVVTIDPMRPEAVVLADKPYDPLVVGIVSTRPAILLSGPTQGAYDIWEELEATLLAHEANPSDDSLAAHADKLESILDSWERGEVPVALAGRVPTLVNGPVRVGEPLTSSSLPGHAEALTEFGPSIGIAMEGHAGGVGKVLVLVQPSWRAPLPFVTDEDPSLTLTAGVTEEERGIGSQGRQGRRPVLPTNGVGEVYNGVGRSGETGQPGADGQNGGAGHVLIAGGTPAVRLFKEAWGDYDGDGLDDVYVSNPGGGDQLYRNLGDGTFADVSATSGLNTAQGSRLALWQDFDGDGALDLLSVDGKGALSLYAGSGNGSFADATERSLLNFTGDVQEAEWLDYDGDETADLRVLTASGQLFLFHNQGGTFDSIELRGALGAGHGQGVSVQALEARLEALEALLVERK